MHASRLICSPARARCLARSLSGVALASLCAIGAVQQAACADPPQARQRAQSSPPSASLQAGPSPRDDAQRGSTTTKAASTAQRGGPTRSLIIGGGALPESTEVSLEQNVQLAIEVLPGPHAVFFAGGPSAQSVREEPRERHSQQRGSLTVRLGELFAPRKGRTSDYRDSVLRDAARADLASLEDALRSALTERTHAGTSTEAPLVLYIAAHGDQGEQPADNSVATWGNGSLTPHRLAELHDGSTRELRMIVTSCFSGGFAELAFERADAGRGASRAPRCGLFAGTWDRETSGCDPDPDRSVQESYSQHLLHAIAQRDHKGAPLSLQTLDLDRDGAVSLLEAHTRARIASRSIDVPTSTSERFLREVTSHAVAGHRSSAREEARTQEERTQEERMQEERMPEEEAVVRELGAALRLRTSAQATGKLDALSAERAAHDERVASAEELLDDAYWALATLLLERFPVLDDPYHPAFVDTLKKHSAAIEQQLEHSPEALAHQSALRALDTLDHRALELELRETRVLRLVRAQETLRLAAVLRARGGEEWARYQAMLACERRAW